MLKIPSWEEFKAQKLNEVAEDLPPYYPKVNVPATQEDLNNVYKFLEDKFYKGKLPKTPIKFAPLAKNYFGKAHVDYTPEGKIKKTLITISTKLKKDPKKFVDTIAHEMIHIWQFAMNDKESTRKYTDATWSEIFGSSDKHTWGHNKYFMQEMERINKEGYAVTIVGDAPNGIELTASVYGIVFDNNIVVWSPQDPTKYIDKILLSIEDRIGVLPSEYTIFQTLESNITQTTRLTKSFELPKNVLNIKYSVSWVEDFLKSSAKILKQEKNDIVQTNSGNVSKEVKEMLPQINKWKDSSFSTYFDTCIMNAFPELRRIPGNQLYSKGNKFNGVKIPDLVSDGDVQYIYNDWLNLEDKNLKKSKAIKYFITSLKFMLMRKEPNKREIDSFYSSYVDDYKERVSLDKFKKVLKDVIINEFKKEAKKAGKVLDDEQFKGFNILFKDTWLSELF